MQDLIQRLKAAAGDGFLYLATPYSRYPAGMEQAFQDAAIATAWLLRRGVHAFCPITHSHPIAVYGGLSLTDHAIWLPADRPMMDAARGIVVCQMPTWDQSFGIQHEIEVFQAARKPVEYLPWPLS
jgi:hypothetical protein